MKKIAILGSTGSIGTQALEVIRKIDDEIDVAALSAGDNVELVGAQIEEFRPKRVCVKSKKSAELLKKQYPKIEFFHSDEGLEALVEDKSLDLVLVAVSGKIGLKPTVAAIKNGINIALANKETLVMAGDLVMELARENGVLIIPVDSEHSAIFQCIKEEKAVKRLIITASGGPFWGKPFEDMEKATVRDTLNHPKWRMGKKITVDSATLMNKGLEVIEAHYLFGVDYKNIEVVIHPQSIIHSAVEFVDGSVLAQMGLPSMHIPIQYALTYPKRVKGVKSGTFDFIKTAKLDFSAPDFVKFPCLKFALKAGKLGKTYPLALNAANEEAVFAFLENKINLVGISKVVDEVMSSHISTNAKTLEEIMFVDEKVRAYTKEVINKKKFRSLEA